jgi:2-polyprenyl-3-methyl-5-hydroxy-6-metoxy-1,4-benzoquinol methylase
LGLKESLEDARTLVLKSYSYALRDAKEFMNITSGEFYDYSEKWQNIENELFRKSRGEEFYRSWSGIQAHCNICSNIINQHLQISDFQVISSFFKKRGHYIDFGCGTASLSLGLFLEGKLRGSLSLIDVPNDINKFTRYRIEKYNLQNSVDASDILHYSNPEGADGMLCIDVLEHLENASSMFIDKVHPLLKVGGLMYLRSPWRGQLTHIDEAADDFYLNGGRKFLSSRYEEIYWTSSIDISCLYKKLRH